MRKIKFNNSLVTRRVYGFIGCLYCGGYVEGFHGGTTANDRFTIHQAYKATCQDCGTYYHEIYYCFDTKKPDKNKVLSKYPVLFNDISFPERSIKLGKAIEYIDNFNSFLANLKEEYCKEEHSKLTRSKSLKTIAD